jgi:predicted metal-dependent phosphoesterase TrpH
MSGQMPMGRALLHLHTLYSDGSATVEETLDAVEEQGEIDVVAFTDHDDVHAYWDAVSWKAGRPGSRLQPMWGLELTLQGFKHLMVYSANPEPPSRPIAKFLPLDAAVREAKKIDAVTIVPHVDAFWIGLGRRRLRGEAAPMGVDGFELFNPYQSASRFQKRLLELNRDLDLAMIGGSDAHHPEHLFRVIVEFPGRTPADLVRAVRERTATARWGWPGDRIALSRHLQQHSRSMLVHPLAQARGWLHTRLELLARD